MMRTLYTLESCAFLSHTPYLTCSKQACPFKSSKPELRIGTRISNCKLSPVPPELSNIRRSKSSPRFSLAGDMPPFRGKYSYKKQTTYSRNIEGTSYILIIEPGDVNVAFLRFEQQQDGAAAQQVPIPANYQLVVSQTQTPVARAGQMFVITWVGDYDLIRENDGVVLRIWNQKQQAIQPLELCCHHVDHRLKRAK